MTETALVLLSGGQDSATCLAWALDRFDSVHTIGFDYGQRHRVELDCREPLRAGTAALNPAWARRLGPDLVLDARVLAGLSASALVSPTEIATPAGALPSTFVPGRNLLFLTLAAAHAHRIAARHLVAGVCETDYSGYPDCRDDTIKALQVALNLGMEQRFVLHTPLMFVDKPNTWRLAETLGGEALVALIRTQSHSCYQGDRSTLHAWGYGCDACPACTLRARGYAAYREKLQGSASSLKEESKNFLE